MLEAHRIHCRLQYSGPSAQVAARSRPGRSLGAWCVDMVAILPGIGKGLAALNARVLRFGEKAGDSKVIPSMMVPCVIMSVLLLLD